MNEKLKVLIVDDYSDLKDFLKEVLEINHYLVDTEESFFPCLKNRENKEWDLLITDYYIPGEDVIEMLHQFRESNPKTKVILMTGCLTEDELKAESKIEFDGFIMKPFGQDLILKTVQEVMGEKMKLFR